MNAGSQRLDRSLYWCKRVLAIRGSIVRDDDGLIAAAKFQAPDRLLH